MHSPASTVAAVRFSGDRGTDFSGESSSVTDLAVLREALPFLEPEGRLSGSEFPGAFRFDRAGLVLIFSSSEPMIIISVGPDEVRMGVDWEAEPKKECKVAVLPVGAALFFFGLWGRDMTWDGDGGRSRDGTGEGPLGVSAHDPPDYWSTWPEVELTNSTLEPRRSTLPPANPASQRRAPPTPFINNGFF